MSQKELDITDQHAEKPTAWARKPDSKVREFEQRRLTDERGRLWTGSVTSGTLRGAEEHPEVVFVCEDQSSELKRVARLDVEAKDAHRAWRKMTDAEVLETFRRSEPA